MTPEVIPATAFGTILSFPLQVSVSETALILAVTITVAFWTVMTMIYLYHWRKFPYDQTVLRRLERLYLFVSASLILLALGGMFAL